MLLSVVEGTAVESVVGIFGVVEIVVVFVVGCDVTSTVDGTVDVILLDTVFGVELVVEGLVEEIVVLAVVVD